MKSKYKGIDEREIKCCCNNPKCAEGGISFDFDEEENKHVLKFHFLEHINRDDTGSLFQRTRAMMLNKETTKELINKLKSLKFK